MPCDFSLTGRPSDLYKQAAANQWLEPPHDEDGTPISEFVPTRGFLLQRDDGGYATYPSALSGEVAQAILKLDVPVAFTMSSEVTSTLLGQITPEQTKISDPRSGIVLPIVDSVEAIAAGAPHVSRENFICLCKQEGFVLVWADAVDGILAQGSDIETWLVGLVRALSSYALAPY